MALVPGEEAPLLPLDLPAGIRASVRARVARAQIEGVLGSETGDLEMYVGTAAQGTDTAALVVSAERARTWRQRLETAGAGLRGVLPDYLALDSATGVWVLNCEKRETGPRLLARLGPSNGFAAGLPHALAQLRAALAKGPRPDHVRLSGEVPDPLRRFLDDAGLRVETVSPDQTALAGFGPEEMAFNLQRDRAADRVEIQRMIRRWRLPLAAMILGLAALGTAIWIDGTHLEKTAAARMAEAQGLARSAFLPDAPILNLRQQVGRVIAARQQQQDEITAQAGPLDLLRRSAAILTESGAKVTRIRQTSNDVVRVELETPDFLQLERLVDQLARGGVVGTVVTSEATAGTGVTALVEVSARPSGGAR